jgi:hypothetical protein
MWAQSSMEPLQGGWEITEVLVRHGSERRLLWNQFSPTDQVASEIGG